MRIIAGEFRSRLLLTPRDAETVRPIPDRVKESLFSLLRGQFEEANEGAGANVLDLFAGTGAIGLEAVSRGAAWCVMVEKDRDVADLLRKNIASLGVQARCEVVLGDALGPSVLARCPDPLNIAFMDPPYPVVRSELGYRRVIAQAAGIIQRLAPGGFLVLRTPWPLFIEPADEPSPRGGPRHPRHSRRGPDADDAVWGDARGRAERGGNDRARKRHISRHETIQPEDDVEALDRDENGDPDNDTTRKRQVADMLIPGAIGPETHTYHQMGVHLYMRQPPPAKKE